MICYMTNFSNYKRAIPPTLLLLLFLSNSFRFVLLLFLLAEPSSLVASGKLLNTVFSTSNVMHRMDLENSTSVGLKTNPLYPNSM